MTNLLFSLESGFVKDEKAFLFTLSNPTGARPTKLPQTADSNAGIWCHANYGAGFGSANGCTIAFPSNSNANSSNCTITDAYGGFECPEERALSTFISGSTSFNMNCFEVFGLKDA